MADLRQITLGAQAFDVPEEHVELTQAEYDALTPAEKNNGKVYFVTDGQGGGGGAQTEVLYLHPNNRILFTRCGDVYSIRLSEASAEEIEACADLIKSHVDSKAVIYLPVLVGVAATLNRVYGYLAIHQSTCTVFKIATYGGSASALDATDRAFGTGTWIKS